MLIVFEVQVVSDYHSKRLRTDSFWLRLSNLTASYLFLVNVISYFGAVTIASPRVVTLQPEVVP